jgi:predicted protein tyrosine phosphatase
VQITKRSELLLCTGVRRPRCTDLLRACRERVNLQDEGITLRTSLVNIIVCPLSKVQGMVEKHRPERVVSLLDPGFEFPDLGPAYRDRHLRLCFHDAHDAAGDLVVPGAAHVRQLLDFFASWTRSAPMLIHCRAGISRSTAAGFIAACLHDAARPELDIAHALRSASALARPNELMIQLADAAMGRDGRMLEVIRHTGRNLPWMIAVNENTPFELSIGVSADGESAPVTP